MFGLTGKIIESSESESQSDYSKGDNACTYNPQEPTRKRFPNSTFSLAGSPNLFMFLGTVRFGNDHIAAILSYGDLKWGNILITRVYFIEGLGHNLFWVGQFCDSDLEVAFRRNTFFVRNLKGVDLLKGNLTTNLTLSISMKWPLHLQFASWLVLLLPTMYDDYIGGQPSFATRTALAAQAPQVLQTLTTSTTTADTASTPTNSSSQATNIPNTSYDVDELEPQQQHVQQQDNQALPQPKIVADNVPNAMLDGNMFVNPFALPSTSAAESSSSQYVDP
ncbi:hypothetical protein Tco_0330783 [Tanacetum coccineum]